VKKKEIREIYDAAVLSVMPENLISNNSYLKSIKSDKIHLFGSGKAAFEMAKEIEKIFGENIIDGLIITPNEDKNLKRVEVFQSTHPNPSNKSIVAAKKMFEKFIALKEDDFFIYLLSGGSSALLELPREPISLDDFIKTTKILLENSVPIEEINIVRKHLSKIKGGQLGLQVKAKGVVLVISDVIGDDLEAIGSAVLFCDSSTFKDAKDILYKYKLYDKLPASVKDVLEKEICETPKSVNKNIEHIIIGNNKIALKKAKQKAENLGYSCTIVTNELQGDVKIVAKKIVDLILCSDQDVLLFGGECTVDVLGDGLGGRNQELCLRVLKLIKNHPNIIFLSGGSDGIDGNTRAAGAIVDSKSYQNDIDYFLQKSDSYNFLKRGDNLLVTGSSGTNVMDIMIAIKGVKNV